MNRKLFVYIVFFVICDVIFLNIAAYPEPIKSSESMVKATFLYHFAKFTQWPEGTFQTPDSPIFLCILGEDTLGEALGVIENKTARGRRILIRHCRYPAETDGCHILFIRSPEKEYVLQTLTDIRGLPCVTVSDTETFTRQGGMIRLFRQGNKIRFEINLKAVKEAGLKISSRMLKLARIFRPGGDQ